MKLTLRRRAQDPRSTPGDLYVDGTWYCCTLELPKGNGGPGTCLNAGIYPIEMYDSPHWGIAVPLLQNTGVREYIEIHPGNWPKDTHGCIVLGMERTTDAVWHSGKAFDPLNKTIQAAVEAEGCSIEILDWTGNAEQVQDAATAEN